MRCHLREAASSHSWQPHGAAPHWLAAPTGVAVRCEHALHTVMTRRKIGSGSFDSSTGSIDPPFFPFSTRKTSLLWLHWTPHHTPRCTAPTHELTGDSFRFALSLNTHQTSCAERTWALICPSSLPYHQRRAHSNIGLFGVCACLGVC